MASQSATRTASWELASSHAAASGRPRWVAAPSPSGCTRGRRRRRRRYHQVPFPVVKSRAHAGGCERRQPYGRPLRGGARPPRAPPAPGGDAAPHKPLSYGPRLKTRSQQRQQTAALPAHGVHGRQSARGHHLESGGEGGMLPASAVCGTGVRAAPTTSASSRFRTIEERHVSKRVVV